MAVLLQSLLEILVYREESLPRGFTCLPWLAPKANESGDADAVLSEIAIVHSFVLVGWIAAQEICCMYTGLGHSRDFLPRPKFLLAMLHQFSDVCKCKFTFTYLSSTIFWDEQEKNQSGKEDPGTSAGA
jgi:hypothetical protein